MAEVNEGGTSLRVGFQGYFALKIIPKVHLVFDEPDSTTVRKFTSPDAFTFQVPIRGGCKNLSANMPCSLWWIIDREGVSEEIGPVSGMIVVESDGRFHIEIGGKPPEIDVLKFKLFNKGVVRYRISPEMPRAISSEFTSKALSYSLPISVDIEKNSVLAMGSRLSVTPNFPKLFESGAVRVIFKETDDGEGEVTSTATGQFSYTWTGGNRKPCTWMIGFSKSVGGTLTYAEATEQGDFEFGYELQVSADEKEFVTVATNKNLVSGIKRPKVEVFKLVFEGYKVYAAGKISGFAPSTNVPLLLFLKKGACPENTIRFGNQTAFKEVDPDDKGEFKTLLFDLKPMAKAGVLPDTKSLFAMMKPAPQVWHRAFDTPLHQVLDYDETKFAGLNKEQDFVVKSRAMWICSEETESIAQEVTRVPPLIFGTKVTKEFKTRLCEICTELQVEPDYMMAAIAFETGETFSASIKNAAGSGAVGLIQFMPSTAKSLDTTSDMLSKMTDVEQLEYVLKYFMPYKGKIKTLEDLYMVILYPVAVGKSNDYVLFERGTTRYSQNSGLDINRDGKITKGEAAAVVREKLTIGESTRG